MTRVTTDRSGSCEASLVTSPPRPSTSTGGPAIDGPGPTGQSPSRPFLTVANAPGPGVHGDWDGGVEPGSDQATHIPGRGPDLGDLIIDSCGDVIVEDVDHRHAGEGGQRLDVVDPRVWLLASTSCLMLGCGHHASMVGDPGSDLTVAVGTAVRRVHRFDQVCELVPKGSFRLLRTGHSPLTHTAVSTLEPIMLTSRTRMLTVRRCSAYICRTGRQRLIT
jgi:hypothetical protein